MQNAGAALSTHLIVRTGLIRNAMVQDVGVGSRGVTAVAAICSISLHAVYQYLHQQGR